MHLSQPFSKWYAGFFTCGLFLLSVSIMTGCTSAETPTAVISPSPTVDRLAEPALPADPTQLELGRWLYWMNCMPCHGDYGQGLTAEFRALYVEDENCWAVGCHGGRLEDGGFPIPTVVPAIISTIGDLPPFATPQALFEFLKSTHPPQNPGFMPDEDYWALTAYLLNQSGRLQPGETLGTRP
jgi:hypothetical protein